MRVTHSELHTEGYTMTQDDGWFDFMVNGGGAVTLKFGKSPFPPQIRTLFAPWNEVNKIQLLNYLSLLCKFILVLLLLKKYFYFLGEVAC